MKKLERLGKKLSNEDQKKLSGGIVNSYVIKGMTGFEITNGQCYVDFLAYSYSTGEYYPSCHNAVEMSFCDAGHLDPCPTTVC
jgi:hypothetical protein